MDNLETPATSGTRHRTKTNKINLQQKTKKMSNTDTTKNLGVNPGVQQLSSFQLYKKTSILRCGSQSLLQTSKTIRSLKSSNKIIAIHSWERLILSVNFSFT